MWFTTSSVSHAVPPMVVLCAWCSVACAWCGMMWMSCRVLFGREESLVEQDLQTLPLQDWQLIVAV